MDKADREKLKQAAQKATPGPWEQSALAGAYIVGPREHNFPVIAAIGEYGDGGDLAHVFEQAEQNMAHITLANPSAVLSLLEEIERLEKVVDAAVEWRRYGNERKHEFCVGISPLLDAIDLYDIGQKRPCEEL